MNDDKLKPRRLTVEQYRAALKLAGLDQDQIRGCDVTDNGWIITLFTPSAVQYLLTPDGRYSVR